MDMRKELMPCFVKEYAFVSADDPQSISFLIRHDAIHDEYHFRLNPHGGDWIYLPLVSSLLDAQGHVEYLIEIQKET